MTGLPPAPVLGAAVLAAALAWTGLAAAQDGADGALVSTAPAAGMPSAEADAGPEQIRRTPVQPLMAPWRPDDRGPHGSVSAMVGTGGVRGAAGYATVRPKPGVSISVAGSYYEGPVYYPGFGPDNAARVGYPSGYGPGAPLGYQPGELVGETSEFLPPRDEPAPAPGG